MDWQPIITAPRDVELLVLRRDGGMHVARVGGFDDRRYGILSADFGNASCSIFFPIDNDYANADDAPTHWMSLPAVFDQEQPA